MDVGRLARRGLRCRLRAVIRSDPARKARGQGTTPREIGPPNSGGAAGLGQARIAPGRLGGVSRTSFSSSDPCRAAACRSRATAPKALRSVPRSSAPDRPPGFRAPLYWPAFLACPPSTSLSRLAGQYQRRASPTGHASGTHGSFEHSTPAQTRPAGPFQTCQMKGTEMNIFHKLNQFNTYQRTVISSPTSSTAASSAISVMSSREHRGAGPRSRALSGSNGCSAPVRPRRTMSDTTEQRRLMRAPFAFPAWLLPAAGTACPRLCRSTRRETPRFVTRPVD